eukprot:10061627-Alexandrium_andersonii.AAC.1
MNDRGIVCFQVDSTSPWQQGRAERVGGLLKEQRNKMAEDLVFVSKAEMELAIVEAVESRS